jgi:preprotein translocase subunit SecG
MTILITIVHVIVCFFLIAVVLLQSGKSGDLAAAFGGQGSQTAFGPRGAASVLSRATTWSAIIFMVTSITLSIFAARRSRPHVRALRSETVADEIAARSVRTADGSAKSGSNTKINCKFCHPERSRTIREASRSA